MVFGSIPRLFDRDFALAYWLPGASLTAGAYGALAAGHVVPPSHLGSQADVLAWAAAAALCSLVVALVLFVANVHLYTFLMGNGRANPLRLLLPAKQRQYRELRRQLLLNEETVRRHLSRREPVPSEVRRQGAELRRAMAVSFVDAEDQIVPTTLGNTLRAAEAYPQAAYGLENGALDWYRLVAVIPRQYRQLIGNAKATTDFWVNELLVALAVGGCYLGALGYSRRFVLLWLLPLVFGLPAIAALAASAAARQWAELVRAAFDVYLPELDARLHGPREQRAAPARTVRTSPIAGTLPEPATEPAGEDSVFSAVMMKYQREKAQRARGADVDETESVAG